MLSKYQLVKFKCAGSQRGLEMALSLVWLIEHPASYCVIIAHDNYLLDDKVSHISIFKWTGVPHEGFESHSLSLNIGTKALNTIYMIFEG